MIDDAQLLRRYVEHQDEAAFSELVQRHVGFVYAAALRQARGNAALAQDIAQAVFSDLARKAATLAEHEVIVGWLHTATRFAAANALRAERRRQRREWEVHLMNLGADSEDGVLDWERLHPVLDAILGELKERERTAILLRFFEKKPLAEVAARMLLTESAARACVDRALDKMRDQLGRHGVTSTSAALAMALANQVSVAVPAGVAASISSAALSAAAGQAAAGIVFFMSTTKIILSAAAIAVLLALGWNTREQASARREAEAALANARAEVTQREASLLALRQRERAADQALVVVQTEANQANAAPAAQKSAATKAPARLHRSQTPEVQLGFQYLARHPDLKRVLVERSRARVASWYSPLYGVLALTVDQQQKLETLLIEEQGVYGSLPEGQYALLPGTGMEPLEIEQQLKALLGPTAYEKFSEVAHTIQARRVATDLAADAYQAGEPLTDEQVSAIIRVVSQATPSTSRSGPNYGGLNPGTLATQLAGTLSPVQLQPLLGMGAQQQLNRAVNAAGRGSTPPSEP